MQIDNPNISFQGKLFAHMGGHVTKPIFCCQRGDKKFIRFINEIAQSNPDSYIVRISDNLSKNLEVDTVKPPQLSLKEKILFLVKPIQNKVLKMSQEGKIDYFTYRISELEYNGIKRRAPHSLKKELEIFEQHMYQKISKEQESDLRKIIY